MKMYTEEQIKMLLNKMNIFYSLEDLNPIELPSNDEIGQQFKNHSEDWQIRQALEEGAKWMRDKLTNTKEK